MRDRPWRPRRCGLASLVASRSGCGSGRSIRRSLDLDDVTVDGRRRPSRRAALRGAVGRRHAQRAARRRGTCRRCSSRRRSPPRIVASGRIPASIPIAIARALRQNLRRGPRRRRRLDDHAAGRQAAAEPPRAEARRGACARRSARRCWRCGSSTASTSARSSALYLNLAPTAIRSSAPGSASRAYFGVEPSMLTPAQAAFLAGLPQRPSGTTRSAIAARPSPGSDACSGACSRPAR